MVLINPEHLFDYEGPVQNIAPHFVFDIGRIAIALPCVQCFEREIPWLLVGGKFNPYGAYAMMLRKSYYYQLPLVSTYYMSSIAFIEVCLWMGQCQRCGVVYQSWYVKPTNTRR